MGGLYFVIKNLASRRKMLLRTVAKMSLARHSRALIHSSRISAHSEGHNVDQEEQTLIKKANAMLPYLTSFYGNPHSRTHAYGWEAEEAMEIARAQIADLIGADAKEIVFTSGATESNNISVKGVARFYASKKKHVITTQTEHKCVLDSCRQLENEGFEVTYLPVQSNGRIDLEEFKATLRPTTSLVSVMTVNNEIGVVQPVTEIGKLCRSNKTFFHTDAAQAIGKIH